jgi:hypothetical protein
MFGLPLRAFVILMFAVALTACGTRPKPAPEELQVYDIRGATVAAKPGISSALIRGIKMRLDRSIHDTVRPDALAPAIMNVAVMSVTTIPGYDGTRTETQVSVTLADPSTGQPIFGKTFTVSSFSISDRDTTDLAAEAVVARLRIDYQLSQPVIQPASATAPRLSTRLNDDTLVPIENKKGDVIPLKQAPVVGADQDPILNSKTAVNPARQQVTTVKKQPVVSKPKQVDPTVEDGAKAKVVIKTKTTQPAADEPCVETLDKKC